MEWRVCGRDRRWSTRAIALAVSSGGHVVLIAALLQAGLLPFVFSERRIEGVRVPGAGYSLKRATLVFIEEFGSANHFDRPAPPNVAEDGILRLHVRSLRVPILEMSEIEDAEGTVESFEATDLRGNDPASLLERYLGQVRARIERAWDSGQRAQAAPCRLMCPDYDSI